MYRHSLNLQRRSGAGSEVRSRLYTFHGESNMRALRNAPDTDTRRAEQTAYFLPDHVLGVRHDPGFRWSYLPEADQHHSVCSQ